jgi:hypothetical protein
MAFDDHVLLDRGPQPPTPPVGPPRRSPTRWIVLGAAGVIVGALLVLWWMIRAQPGTATPAPTAATDVTVGSNRPKPQPLDLPPLDASDGLLRQLVAALSDHPLLARLLATDGLVRGAVLAAIQIGEGRTPSKPLAILRPSSRLAVTSAGRIDPRAYARWDGATGALVSVDAAQAAQVYVNLKRLFDQAYGELGHPGGDFDDAIVLAIRTLDDTPRLAADPVLLRRPGYYEHDDPALRSLLPVQKQMLLLGPDNRDKVMRWLKQLAAALELKVD